MPEGKLFVSEDDRDDEPYLGLSASERDVFTTPSDPDVETLLKRIGSGELILRPPFQRVDVWNTAKKSKLIESLLLNLPIPPCFFAEDREGGARVVVDGQQRLRAIDDYCHGRFALTQLQVLYELNGAKWEQLPNEFKRKLLNRVIRTLVITHHTSPELRFEIFERLNTGGVPLTDQEIRNGTLRGGLNALLDELANNELFLHLIRRRRPDDRLRHHELVLRYLCLSLNLKAYSPPLKFFMTDFMRENRDPSDQLIAAMRSNFFGALTGCELVFGADSFRRFKVGSAGVGQYETVLNRAVFDVQMLGFTGVDVQLLHTKSADIRNEFVNLSINEAPFIESLTRATDHRSRMGLRLGAWFAALRSLGIVVPLLDGITL